MNPDDMPFWLRATLERVADFFTRHFRLPLCAAYGEGIKVARPRHLVISGPGVVLGSHCRLDAAPDAQIHLSCWPYAASEGVESPAIKIGDYCTLSPGVRLISAKRITTGHSCTIAGNVYITDADWHERNHRVFPPGPTAPVSIGNNVWLAESVIVLKGVTIGDNTIVGAGSVVTQSLPANVIAAGNPARVIKALDPDEPGTDRRALYETLNYVSFEPAFWRERLAGNTLWRWLLGVIWPAWRQRPRT